MYTLLAFVLCNFLWHQSGLCSWQFQNFQNVVSFNDLNLPENLTTGSADVRSRLECFIMCQKTANCVTIFVKLGMGVECKFSEMSTDDLRGQLTKGDHFRCFSQFNGITAGNGIIPGNTSNDQGSTGILLDFVGPSSDWSTIDWIQSSDMIQSSFDLPLSPSEQSLLSQTLQPTIAVASTMDETTIFVTSPAFDVSWTTASDLVTATSSFAISSMTTVASNTIYTGTSSIASGTTRLTRMSWPTARITVSAINVSPTQTVTMSCSVGGEEEEDTDCSNGDTDEIESIIGSGENGSSDGSGIDSASPDVSNDKR